MTGMEATMDVLNWHHCYDRQWRDLIVPGAFTHPAKFAPGLIDRIYRHGLTVGWWRVGDLVGDPFGGIAGGGIMAAYAGLGWIGVELEQKFVELAQQNIDLHRPKWEALGDPVPVLVQGDSRRFAEIVGGVAGVVTSPPYADSIDGTPDSIDWSKADPKWNTATKRTVGRVAVGAGYGDDPAQIGRAKPGDLDAVVTSPPYEDSVKAASHGIDLTKAGPATGNRRRGAGTKNEATLTAQLAYGDDPGQIGNISGQTYWQAMDQVYRQCHQAIRPGGYMDVVVKDYVKNRQRVPLCDQTLTLLEHVGFEPVCRIRAWLTTPGHDGLFGERHGAKSRKSFFRRLAEAKGSPAIDWEEVLVVRRAGGAA